MRSTLLLILLLKKNPARTAAFHQIGVNVQSNGRQLTIRNRFMMTKKAGLNRRCIEAFSSQRSISHHDQPESKPLAVYTPFLTSLAALSGVTTPLLVSKTLGSIEVMQMGLATLMLAMGLTITPKDLSEAFQKPSILAMNAFFCFGLMPTISYLIATVLSFNPDLMAGTVLLGSVSGGQASNLFTLLAGGDVALSIICTLSTTLLGVVATPLLVKYLLGHTVAVNGVAVLRSVASLVLAPLLAGE